MYMSHVCQNCGKFNIPTLLLACSLNSLLRSQGVFVPRDESFTPENNQISEESKSDCGSISGPLQLERKGRAQSLKNSRFACPSYTCSRRREGETCSWSALKVCGYFMPEFWNYVYNALRRQPNRYNLHCILHVSDISGPFMSVVITDSLSWPLVCQRWLLNDIPFRSL